MPTLFPPCITRPLALAVCFFLFLSCLPCGSVLTGAAANEKKAVKTSQKKTVSQRTTTAGKKHGTATSRKRGYKKKTSATAGYAYKSCVIYNAKSKKVIFSRNGDRKIPPASLTKILSMYVAEDAIRNRKLNRNAKVTVSARAAAAGGSRMGLRAGDKVSLDELLRGMAVASGNDASIAVAEFIGGSEQNFVRMMNKKARGIGMKRSTFKNANGLPAPGQYTTAKDMLTLANSYLAAYPDNLAKYHNKSVHIYKNKYSCNANPLLGVFEGADGLKTGFVSASGYNLIATAKRKNQRYIGVILGAPSSSVRAVQARNLMEACFTRPSTFAASASEDDSRKVVASQKKAPSVAAKNTGKKKTVTKSKASASVKTAKGKGGNKVATSSSKGKSKRASTGKVKKRSSPPAVKSTADKSKKGRKGASAGQGSPTASKSQKPKELLVLRSYS